MRFRFAHLADCHIGAWREHSMKDASIKAFETAIHKTISANVDFILIAGDLFNTSIPSIDSLNSVVMMMRKLKEKGIKVYIIPGSHDFSPTGKTMIDVLENAGLVTNVMKIVHQNDGLKLNFSYDEKTGAKITGIFGKKGMLDRNYYESIIKKDLEDEKGFKIFMFHTAIGELLPSEMTVIDSNSLSLLPHGFNYYAGGHIHYVFQEKKEGYGIIAFPGPIFPNSFSEFEKLKHGGFYIVDCDSESYEIYIKYEAIKLYEVVSINLDCNEKNIDRIISELEDIINKNNFIKKIVTIRLYGQLNSGKASDIPLNEIIYKIYNKGAYFVMKNTTKLLSKDLEHKRTENSSVDEIESMLINENVGKVKIDGYNEEEEKELTRSLMRILAREKNEGETKVDFEERIIQDVKKILKLN